MRSICARGRYTRVDQDQRNDPVRLPPDGIVFLTTLYRHIAVNHSLPVWPEIACDQGCAESFSSRLRDELLHVEEIMNLAEARWFAQRRRHEHHAERPHSSLGYQTPAEFASQCSAEPLTQTVLS